MSMLPPRLLSAPTSRTKQQFKAECDINNIMKRYQRDGIITHLKQFGGRYEDVSGAVSFQEAYEIVHNAQAAFGTLPSSVRKRFDNDPGHFMQFALNPANKAEMVKLGLAKEPPSTTPSEPATTTTPAPTPA